MDNMEQTLGELLGNPQLMQQIMSMAQTLGGTQSVPSQPHQKSPASTAPNVDPGLIQKLSGLIQDCSASREETALLQALSPFLTRSKIQKLDKAMRAAKMAKFASSFLSSGGLQMLGGR